ncbi:MAG: glycosyltransferase 61 family protein [Blastocatellia bacterium]|nr:glycosyltransferase 61 family protein [Blastocatellia bacterium]
MLRIKATIIELLLGLRYAARRLLSFVPGGSRLLGLPGYRIRSLKNWIERERGRTDWWRRVHAPGYETIAPMRIEACFPAPEWILPEHEWARKDVGRYHVFGEVYLASLPGGRVLGPNGTVLTPDGGIVEESSWCNGYLEKDRSLTALRLPPPERLPGHFFYLGGDLARGYSHWLFDALPRLMMIERVARPDLRLILFGRLNQWQADSLRLLGYDRCEALELGDRHIECEWLHFPSAVGETGSLSPLALGFLRERLLNGRDAARAGRRRLYISRRLAGRRHIVNEDELIPILESRGFEIVTTERMAFEEQVALFADAEVVIGAHGAGLSNLAFAPAGCRVLEVLTPTCLRWMYYLLCAQLGQRYFYLIADETIPAGDHHRDAGFDNIELRPETLTRALDAILPGARTGI